MPCSIVQQLNLYGLRSRIRRRFERRFALLKLEPMGDQRFQIDQAFLDQHDGLRIRLAVPEQEPDVDLSEGGMHERNLQKVLSNTDNKDCTSESGRLRC